MRPDHPSQYGPIVGKDEIVHQIAVKAGLSLTEASAAVDAFMNVIREQLAAGHAVRLIGFGKWLIRTRRARQVRSIRGGELITLPARRRVGFAVGSTLGSAAHDQLLNFVEKLDDEDASYDIA